MSFMPAVEVHGHDPVGLIGEVTSLIDRFSWFVLCIADKKTKGKSLGLNWEKKAC